MYFCWKSRCNTESLLMKNSGLPALYLHRHHSLCRKAAPKTFTSLHLQSSPAIHAVKPETFTRTCSKGNKLAFQKHSCQLTGCHVCVSHFLPQSLDMLKQGMRVLSLKRTSIQGVGEFLLIRSRRFYTTNPNGQAERRCRCIAVRCVDHCTEAEALMTFWTRQNNKGRGYST